MLKTTHRRTNGNSNKFFDKVNRGYRVEYYRPEMIITRPDGPYMGDSGALFPMLIWQIKFMFSKKATKIDQIFTVDLTFTK